MKTHSSLESHLGFWMRFVSNHVHAAFEKKLADYGVNVAEWVVLRLLFDQRMLSPGVLAEKTGLTRGAMSKLLDRLFNKRLIERAEAAGDRRFQEIKLTTQGKQLVPKLATQADINDQQFFGHLSHKQKEQVVSVLREIVSVNKLEKVPVE